MAKETKDTKEKPKKQLKTRKKVTDKWKKKSWFTLIAPAEFERKVLGETVVEKPESLIGKTIKITARELANQPKKQHIQLKFKVISYTGNKADTKIVGHEIKDSFLKRLVRRRSSKIMSVKTYLSKDKIKFRIKFIIVTEKKVSRKQKASVQKKTEEMATKIISQIENNKVIDELVFGSIPNKIYPELKPIVPIKRIEITKSTIIKLK